MYDFLKTILLLFLNTIVEFLPISSTAHSILFNNFLNIETDFKFILALSQLSITIVIIFFFYKEIFNIIKNFFCEKQTRHFCYNMVITTIPTVIFGTIMHKFIRKYLYSNQTIAIFLIIGGFFMLLLERYLENKKELEVTDKIEEIQPKIIYKVGLFQTVSLIPGISRSAMTICAALLYGLPRSLAINFSFFLSIPISLAGSCFDIFKNIELIQYYNYPKIFIYFIINIIFALFFIKKILNFLKKHRLDIFGYYRVIFGLIILIFF